MKSNQVAHINIQKVSEAGVNPASDQVAVEEPLEIQLAHSTKTGRMQKNIAVTMRTPGNDDELAAGFLFTEGIINEPTSIESIKKISFDDNRILVTLKENVQPNLANISRNFYSTSSCGICGKASIEAITTISPNKKDNTVFMIDGSVLYQLAGQLQKQQVIFQHTGGIHASALFSLDGNFISLREDVGRHNALDKIIGASLLEGNLPLQNYILFLSGRASFELIQKAAMAGIPIVAAVGAPSSLAVELAAEVGITLVGFLRDGRFNLYSGSERIKI